MERSGALPDLTLLHCVSDYPVSDEQVGLGCIEQLRDEFDYPIGYSDHSLGIVNSLYAVAAGAKIVEKHFTLDNNYSDFRDHQLSADPKEFAEMVKGIRKVETILGNRNKFVQDSEKENIIAYRRSIALKNSKKEGEVIGEEDLMWIRPGNGISPGNEGSIIGKKVKCDMKSGSLIRRENLEI